jgi:predicted DNA-binding protein (MmcQ/YjbR family)
MPGVLARKLKSGGQQELIKLRKICMAIPGAFEKLSHGEPCWFTGPKGKTFAMLDNHHHGAEHICVWIPAPMEVQRGLVASEPNRYWVPPYVGHKGWVAIILDTKPDWKVVATLINEAFQLVAPAIKKKSKPT